MKTVNDMCAYASENNIKLLSNFDASFWEEYVTNYSTYDKVFNRLYKSFVYFEQLEDEDISDVVTNFVEAVEGHLIINRKKYEELYRVNILDNNEYLLLGNVNITETMDKNGEKTSGEREDSESKGQKLNSEILGQKINSETIGQREDSESLGDREDTESLGRREDTINGTIGQVSITKTNSIAPYNSEAFNNDTRTQELTTPRLDYSDNIQGAQSNTRITGSQDNSRTIGSQQNSFTEGSQNNSYTEGSQQNTYVKGTQEDSYSEDYTYTRKGYNGIIGADVLNKHQKFWSLFEFYSYIFGEIAKEMLLTNC